MASKRKSSTPRRFDSKRRAYAIVEYEQDTPYSIGSRNSRSFKGSVVKETTYDVKFKPEFIGKQVKDVQDLLRSMFSELLREAKKDYPSTALARMYIRHPAQNHAIIVAGCTLETMTVEKILAAIDTRVQSQENLDIDELLVIQLGVAKVLRGERGSHITNVQQDRICKKSLITINNTDNICLARAIAVGIAKFEKDVAIPEAKATVDKYYSIIRNGKNKLQGTVAARYQQQAGLPPNTGCTLTEIPRFEETLDVQVIVLAAHLGNKTVYEGRPKQRRVYLYYTQHENGGHFDTIVSVPGLLGKSYFCHHCLKGYDHRTKHTCAITCKVCQNGQCSMESETQCKVCNMTCRSTACFQRHQKHCHKFWLCLTCKTKIDLRKRCKDDHRCGEWQCGQCKEYVLDEHNCYLRADKTPTPINKFIFFDFEATQESGEHQPNFVIAQSQCNDCDDESSTCNTCGSRCNRCDKIDTKTKEFAYQPCTGCAQKEVKFSGPNTADDFSRWLFSKQHRDCTVLAHNGKAYDTYFLLRYVVNNAMTPSLIYNGSKIMSMEIKALNIRVLDSLNFLPMRLAALPKAFGLTELKKGYFPHLFNTARNQNYIGPLPAAEYYAPDTMSSSDRAKFEEWYKQHQGTVFDFRSEIESYCRSDVDILRRACLKFRQLQLDISNVDPFACLTIASVCMKTYKSQLMPETWQYIVPGYEPIQAVRIGSGDLKPLIQNVKSTFVSSPLAKVPNGGYFGRDNFSQDSIRWLEWEAYSRGVAIRHALNGGEIKIPGSSYKVDGFSGNTVFEYNGCIWHGCPQCFPTGDTISHPYTGQSLAQRYALTVTKRRHLEYMGYTVISIWEHEFAQLKLQPKVAAYINKVNVQPRLNPRDSFFGGRTNASKLYYKACENEKLMYVDFTSLYPTVNKYDEYPVGHPEIVTSNFSSIHSYFGIIKCTVLPPRGLYHPVLPYRCRGRLLFPLCKRCAEESLTDCDCTETQRSIRGTWCTNEVQMAVKKGYRVLEIHEVYHFPKTAKYDPETQTGGLFADYVNKFLKIKQEASGWPDWVKNEQDRQKYVKDYFDREGIRLENVEKNPGLRSLAKLCLNSFWGKFGQRSNMGQSQLTTNTADYFKMVADPSKRLKDWHIIHDDMIQLEFEQQDGFVTETSGTNIFIATFTTAHARMRLYSVLDRLKERVCYYDTDSVIYISKPGYYDPPLGDYLGDLTDELDGDFIVEFVSAGPKNYSYKTNSGKYACKVKGFSLNFQNSLIVNFNSMKEEVQRYVRSEPSQNLVTQNNKICRDKYKHVLFNRCEMKKYQVVYEKRVLGDDFDTKPFGY